MTNKPQFVGEKVPFADAFIEASRGVKKFKQGEYAEIGEHPIVDQGQEAIAGYSDEEDGLFTDVPAIAFGDHTRCFKYVEEPFFVGADGVKILKPKLSSNVRFWWHALKATPIENLGYSRHFKLLKAANFYVFDSKQQEMVTSNLDAVLEQISHVEAQIGHLDLLVKSRFVEMFGGALSIESKWDSSILENCVESLESGKSPSCKNVSRKGFDPGVLKLSALSSGRFLPGENKAMLDGETIIKAKEVKQGDILVARKNTPQLVGSCVLVREDVTNLMFPDIVFRMHPNDSVNGEYLAALLSSPSYSSKVRGLAHGSNKSMSNIPKSELAGLSIPLPPLSLQQEFADFVTAVDKSRFAWRAHMQLRVLAL